MATGNLGQNIKKELNNMMIDETRHSKGSKKLKKKTKETPNQNSKSPFDHFNSAINDPRQSSSRAVHKTQTPFASAQHKNKTSSIESYGNNFHQRMFGGKDLEQSLKKI